MRTQEETLSVKTQDIRVVRRLLRYMRPYRWHALLALSLTLASAPLTLAGAVLTQVAVDSFILPQPNYRARGVALWVNWGVERLGAGNRASAGLMLIAATFLLVNCLTFVIKYVQESVLQIMGQRIMFDLREQLFAHLHKLSISYFDRHPVGRLLTRLTGDVDALNEMFAAGVVSVLGNLTILLFIAGWMLWANWRLSLVSFTILPLLIAATIWFRRNSRKAFRELRVYLAQLNTFLQERLAGMPVIHLFNREEREQKRFAGINDAYRQSSIETVYYLSIFTPIVEAIGALGIALIVWYGGRQISNQVVTIGMLVAFIQLSKAFFEPISTISEKYSTLQGAVTAAERVFTLLDESSVEATDNRPASGAKRIEGRIEFRDVWFAYQNEDWILKGVSFAIEPGEQVALVGHTGAGKSTIANLLLKLYEIQRGQILVDGVDIRELSAETLRRNIGIVLQDVFLFAGDIESNIRLGNRKISAERLQAAAREVNALSFIERLPQGFATEIKERGAGLSVGQKQLLSFARTLAADPSVLILDEATSSIDSETEALVSEGVQKLMSHRTSLVIAHRLSTIQHVDKIIVMHKGEVRENGTHHELLAARGLYWKLYQLQYATQLSEELPCLA